MSQSEADGRNWFLRISSGVVFGPVPTNALRLWAEQGRIQPGDEISEDRKGWRQAQQLDELDIAWYLEDSAGDLTGPFNKRAAEHLINDGRVGEGASLIYKDDANLKKLVRPADVGRQKNENGQAEFDFGDDCVSVTEPAKEDELETQVQDLKLRIEELETARKQLLQAAEKEKKANDKLLAIERDKTAAIQKELDEAKKLTDKAKADAEAAITEKANAETALAVKAATAPLDARIADLEALVKQTAIDTAAPLNARIADLEKSLAAAPDEIAEPLLKRISALEADLRNAAEATDALEAKAAAEASEPLMEQLDALQKRLDDVSAYSMQTDEAVNNATAPLLVKIDELEADKAAAVSQAMIDAAAPLKARIAELEERIAAKNSEETENLRSESGETAELRTRIVTLDTERNRFADEKTAALAKVATLETEYAELLEFSNSRDRETAAQLESDKTAIDDLKVKLGEERKKLQQALSSMKNSTETAVSKNFINAERDFLSKLLEDGLKRQKLIQEHVSKLNDMHNETATETAQRHAQFRADKELRGAMEDLEQQRLDNAQLSKRFEERERNLKARTRMLEAELDKAKGAAMDTENLRQRNQQLIEQVRESEQALSLEKQKRSFDQDQLAQAQQALIDRIARLEAERNSLPLTQTLQQPCAPTPPSEPKSTLLNPSGKRFHVTPWMRFKK